MHLVIGRLATAAACATLLLLGGCRERHKPLEPTVSSPAPAPAAATPAAPPAAPPS